MNMLYIYVIFKQSPPYKIISIKPSAYLKSPVFVFTRKHFPEDVNNGDNVTRWRHQMETFSALLALLQGNLPITGGFPSQRPMLRSFDIFFHLPLNKRSRKQSRRRRFQTPSHSLQCYCKRDAWRNIVNRPPLSVCICQLTWPSNQHIRTLNVKSKYFFYPAHCGLEQCHEILGQNRD